MKIAMFTDTYFPQVSGVATSIKILKEELEKKGHHVTIFTTTDPDADEFEDAKEHIIRIASIPFLFFTDRRVVIGGMNKAHHIAKEEQYDIVHTHTEFGMGLIGKYVAYRLKIPSIHTYHTMYEKYLHYIANGRLVKPNHVKALSAYFCNATSGVIAPGEQMAKILASYQIEPEIRTIPTGVPIPQVDSANRKNLRAKLGLAEDQLVLLSLSRVAKEKSIDKLIEAMPNILRTYPEAKLVIVGDGPERQALEEQCVQLKVKDAVLFVGEIKHDDVYKYYQMADLYLNASETETQGLTYLEALANGLPVIAKKNDYLSGIITHKAFGDLYEHTALIAQTVIDYVPVLKKTKALSQGERDKLLYEISAERFASKVSDFYQDAIDTYHNKYMDNPKTYLNKKYFSGIFGKKHDKI